MTVPKCLRILTVTAIAALTLAGCGDYIQDPWLSDGEAQLLGNELQRSPKTADELNHRLEYRVGNYGVR